MAEIIEVGSHAMPALGLGLWKIPKNKTSGIVFEAISHGYRHLDSAADYANEREVGEGIHKAIADGLVKRENLWVTSKLWNTFHRPEHVQLACERTLSDLGIHYLDLYLIHFPIALQFVDFNKRYPPEWIHDPTATPPRMLPDRVALSETWAAMEDLVRAGLVKEIGVCNYNTGLLHDLNAYSCIKPAMLQVELHPYLTQKRLLGIARNYGLAITAFSPLGALSYLEIDMSKPQESVLSQSVVIMAAKRLNRTPAQVVLRWGLQRGTAVIPKASSNDHLMENLQIFDFELSVDEMESISALNSNRRFNDPGVFCERDFGTGYPIYD